MPFPAGERYPPKGFPMGRIKPMTDDEKENLRKKALERSEKKKQEVLDANKKEKEKLISQGANPPPPGGGGASGGNGNPGDAPGDSPDSSDPGAGSGGSGAHDPSTARTGNKIPKKQGKNETEIIVDSGKFYAGLPAFSRLFFKAMNNLLKVFNALPFPFEFYIEEMDREESQLFAEAIRPGLEASLPTAGRKHPFIMMGLAFVVGILGKLGMKFKEKKPVEVKEKKVA